MRIKHQVVVGSAYYRLRYPGNLAVILAAFAQPLILGAGYAFLLTFFVAVARAEKKGGK